MLFKDNSILPRQWRQQPCLELFTRRLKHDASLFLLTAFGNGNANAV